MPLRDTWTNSARTTHALMPYCDTDPCQNLASHSYLDFVEIEAPHWWLWLRYPKYELVSEDQTRYGCPSHPVSQRLLLLDGRIVDVPAEFPKSRIRWLMTDGLWAAILAVIFAVLAAIGIAKLM